ncbi:conserved hypothetical protein [Paraburkholderia tropica]
MIAQRFPRVFAPENTATLQFGNDLQREIVHARRQERKHHVEAVTAFLHEPLLHLVGDRLGRADHLQSRIAAHALRQLAHGQVLLPRPVHHALTRRAARIAFGNVRQRPVQIEARDIVTQRDRQGRNPAFRMHERIEQRALLARLVERFADHHERARQDLQMIALAAVARETPFHVRIKPLARLQIRLRREHGLGGLRREFATGFGRSRLHDHGPTLRRPRDIERPAHRVVLAFVIEHVHFLGIEILAARDVAYESVVVPAIPKAGHDVEELARATIALVVLHMFVEAEIQGGIGIRSGDEIPARASAAQMIERGETARDVVRRVEGRRCGGDEADLRRYGRQRGKQRERLKRGGGVAALERAHRHVQHGEMIGHEKRVEARGFERLRKTFQMCEIEIRIGPCARKTPRAGMQADRAHEGAQMQLTQLTTVGHDVLAETKRHTLARIGATR